PWPVFAVCRMSQSKVECSRYHHSAQRSNHKFAYYFSFPHDCLIFFFSSRRRHTRSTRDWSSDVCSSDLSSLNHPHICTLHDIGHVDGVDFLVMEYLEGETLADRLLKGPLPPEQFPRTAVEIADALDRAHK